jgi:hypothetical protein
MSGGRRGKAPCKRELLSDRCCALEGGGGTTASPRALQPLTAFFSSAPGLNFAAVFAAI